MSRLKNDESKSITPTSFSSHSNDRFDSYHRKTPEQREIILNEVNQNIDTLRHDDMYSRSVTLSFYICIVSAIIGVGLILFALGETVLFAGFSKNTILFGCAFVFFIPFFVWIKVAFIPNQEERERRRKLTAARRKRNYLKQRRYLIYKGKDPDDDDYGRLPYVDPHLDDLEFERVLLSYRKPWREVLHEILTPNNTRRNHYLKTISADQSAAASVNLSTKSSTSHRSSSLQIETNSGNLGLTSSFGSVKVSPMNHSSPSFGRLPSHSNPSTPHSTTRTSILKDSFHPASSGKGKTSVKFVN